MYKLIQKLNRRIFIQPRRPIGSINININGDQLYKFIVERITQSRDNQSKLNSEPRMYDCIIAANTIESLSLNNPGWILEVNDENNYNSIITENMHCVSVIGAFKKGKSWLLSKILEKQLPHGHEITTKGLSLAWDSDTKTTYLDTAGIEVPTPISRILKDYLVKYPGTPIEMLYEVEKKYYDDKILTERTLQNFIIDVSQSVFIVVNEITETEQKLITRLCTDFSRTKDFVIIHNMFNRATVESLNEGINKNINDIFFSYKATFCS